MQLTRNDKSGRKINLQWYSYEVFAYLYFRRNIIQKIETRRKWNRDIRNKLNESQLLQRKLRQMSSLLTVFM